MANITGTAQGDLLFGTNAVDTINGQAGNDTVQAGAGNDTITGDAGDDVLFGNKGADSINAGAGNDEVFWTNGDGSDVVNGGDGFDIQRVQGSFTAGETFTLGPGGTGGALFQRTSQVAFQIDMAGQEKLVLEGFGGDDSFSVTGDLAATPLKAAVFRGGDGADVANGGSWATSLTLDGEAGADSLTGGNGPDWLLGGLLDDGADQLAGGGGADLLEGGRGDDTHTGGAGNDVFLFEADEGRDTIQDFASGQDHIALRDFVGPGGAPLTWTDISGKITASGSNSVIDLTSFGTGGTTPDTITVIGYANLTQGDFFLV